MVRTAYIVQLWSQPFCPRRVICRCPFCTWYRDTTGGGWYRDTKRAGSMSTLRNRILFHVIICYCLYALSITCRVDSNGVQNSHHLHSYRTTLLRRLAAFTALSDIGTYGVASGAWFWFPVPSYMICTTYAQSPAPCTCAHAKVALITAYFYGYNIILHHRQPTSHLILLVQDPDVLYHLNTNHGTKSSHRVARPFMITLILGIMISGIILLDAWPRRRTG